VQKSTGPVPRPPASDGMPAGPGVGGGGFWPPADDAGPQEPRLGHWRAWPHRSRRARKPKMTGPFRRLPEDGLFGGVAAGLAARRGFDPTLVRLAMVLLAFFTVGYAFVAYVLVWLLVPVAGKDHSIAAKAKDDRRGIALAVGLGSMLVALLFIVGAAGGSWVGTVGWPLVISAVGLVLIWRNSPPAEQATMRHLVEPLLGLTGDGRRPGIAVRLSAAAVLLIAGVSILATVHETISVLWPLAGVALVIAGIAVMLGPWWLGIARDLVAERRARIRAEERADMAARVHDSVLQTLAMIQRRADQPQQVIQLARAQERELRAWLFDGRAPGSLDEMTLAAGVRQIQQEVEAQHGVSVEAVTVGDCELDEDLAALLAAAREATVNAAKWSGADVVSVFAEVEPASVAVYVRDRGKGFDPAAVPEDRKGLAESIHARMARRGGSATIRSTPGQGTEVSLTMPRRAGERQPSRT
jgi:signal transduction histidine kinase